MARVRFTSRINQWTDETAQKVDMAALEIATDIHRISGVIAPKDTRALVASGRIERVQPGHYRVIYGGGRVPYARMRHFENKKTPGSLRYLERAGDAVSRNFKRYTRDI